MPLTCAAPEADYSYLKVEYQLVRVPLADIVCVEGLKDYVMVHLASHTRPLLSLTSLRGMEEKLPRRQVPADSPQLHCGAGPHAGGGARHRLPAKPCP